MYEGVPLSNFIGWVVVSMLVILIFEILAQRMDTRPIWISGTPRVLANILVLAPFLFDFAVQILGALGLGLARLQQPVGIIPPVVGSIAMTVAVIITLSEYRHAIVSSTWAETIG